MITTCMNTTATARTTTAIPAELFNVACHASSSQNALSPLVHPHLCPLQTIPSPSSAPTSKHVDVAHCRCFAHGATRRRNIPAVCRGSCSVSDVNALLRPHKCPHKSVKKFGAVGIRKVRRSYTAKKSKRIKTEAKKSKTSKTEVWKVLRWRCVLVASTCSISRASSCPD